MKKIFILTILLFTTNTLMASVPTIEYRCPDVQEVADKIIAGERELSTDAGHRFIILGGEGNIEYIPYMLNEAKEDTGRLHCSYPVLRVRDRDGSIRVMNKREVITSLGNAQCKFPNGSYKMQCSNPEDCVLKCTKALPSPPQ